MQSTRRLLLGSCLFAALLVTRSVCQGQVYGYIVGHSSITSFDSGSGLITSSFMGGGTGEPLAVAADGSTLYLPGGDSSSGPLNIVSSQSGQVLNSVPLTYPGREVVLGNDGTTAYVLCWSDNTHGAIDVVDLGKLAVTGTISILGIQPQHVILSPDNTTLYVSVEGSQPKQSCAGNGICVYDLPTLAFKTEVTSLTGNLAVSRDGNSLYVTNETNPGLVRIVSTSTFGISALPTANLAFGPVFVNPLGHWALPFLETREPAALIRIFNTLDNQLIAPFVNAFPGNSSPLSQSHYAAFAPDGKSFWALLSCQGLVITPGCSTPNSAPVLAGWQFPSGTLIAETTIPSDSLYIAFPR